MKINNYKTLLGLIFLCYSCFSSFGQRRTIDDLLYLYETETSDSVKIDLLLKISDKYRKEDNYKNAYDYYSMYIKFEDSVENNVQQNLIYKAREKYQSEKTEKELELIQKEAEINKYQIRKNNYILYFLIGSVLFVIILAILIIQINRIKTGKEISELKQRNLNQQLNPRFIIETVNAIQNSLFQENKAKTNQYLSKFSKLMRLLLDNSQYNEIQLQSEIDMIDLYLNLQKFKTKSNFNYLIDLDGSIDSFELKIPSFILMYYAQKLINVKLNSENEIIVKIRNVQNKITGTICKYNIDNKEFIHNFIEEEIGESKNEKVNKSRIHKIKLLNKNITISEMEIDNSSNSHIDKIVTIYIPLN